MPKKQSHQSKCTYFSYIIKMPTKAKKNYLRTTYINVSCVTWSNPLLQLPHLRMQISAATQLLLLIVLQKNKIDSSILHKNHQNQTENNKFSDWISSNLIQHQFSKPSETENRTLKVRYSNLILRFWYSMLYFDIEIHAYHLIYE